MGKLTEMVSLKDKNLVCKTGLDILPFDYISCLRGKNIGILCNQASINRHIRHCLDILLPYHQAGEFTIKSVFGPQHGIWGYTQDNMIEWEGYKDSRTGLQFYSLYGNNRKPSKEQLNDIDLFVIDLQDIGSRYYTFIWTMALSLETCHEEGKEVMVLDRPNPINGDDVEGTVLNSEYSSFIGLYPLPQRHGMTIGEIAVYLAVEYFQGINIEIIKMEGWRRSMFFPETGLPWVMPSPNIPIFNTTLVYPGMCLLEGTNISEGRGTTRPFEIFGAPWIDGWKLCTVLNRQKLPGVYFRPLEFNPTFQKYCGETCQGGFLHILNQREFRPVQTAIVVLWEIIRHYPDNFRWKNPPYEYEYDKLPFDVLAGCDWLRSDIMELNSISEINERMELENHEFEKIRSNFLQY